MPMLVLVLAATVAAVGTWHLAADSAAPAPPADEEELRSQLHVSAGVTGTTSAAAGAITDSFESGVRRVIVRVVDELDLVIRFEADRSMTLPGSPYLCLVGPFWAPDDAGLSDRCWGDPDLAGIVASRIPDADGGTVRLQAGKSVVVTTRLRRGDVRCDYPPGTWHLEVAFSPPGTPAGPDRLALEDVVLEVPFDPDDGPLPLLKPGQSRYCGLANVVVREQGEPAVLP